MNLTYAYKLLIAADEQRHGFIKLRGVEAMGLGDVKMMFMVGAYLGWRLTILTILIGALSGSLTGVSLMLRREYSVWDSAADPVSFKKSAWVKSRHHPRLWPRRCFRAGESGPGSKRQTDFGQSSP